MSSTYAHYQGPSSLPSDYAILSRLGLQENHTPIPDEEPSAPTEDSDSSRHVTRRESFNNAYYYRPLKPSIGTYPTEGQIEAADRTATLPSLGLPTETTPLLSNPPIPRIEEPIDRNPAADAESKISMFWEELWILTKYALPVFGTHVLEYSLVIASVVSIGHLSTTALAAISLGSMTASVSGFSILQGFASALDTLLPSAWTSPQPQLVGLWAQRMTVVMFTSLIPMFLIWFNAEAILLFLKQDPEVAHLAGVYLRWVSLGLPAYAFNCISRRYFQSQGLFTVPTRIVFIVAPANVLLNWLLVWGPKPFGLGFIGAPLATAISFNFISLSSIIYGIFFTPATAWYPISRRMFTGLGVLVNLGLSGVGQTASEWWAWELVTLAASLLGPVALATQSVLLVSASTTYQAPFALSVATAVRIGNLLGEQKAKRAAAAASTSIVMAFIIALFTSTLFLVFRKQWAYIFNNDPEVVELVASIIPLVALFQVFDGISGVTGGILRAQGKQFLGALLNLSAYYIFGIPLGIYLAFSHHYGLHGLWVGLTFSLVYCAVIGTWVCLRSNWDRQVYKVMQRLKEEDKRRVEDETLDPAAEMERGLLDG
ncbi:MATE efflux family protein [Gymnopilus junonius]|uniref:MATE efflux family protein n=1 Tax=Gymnopilus junonius TaxID=109634 RepID=A0A9P5TG76_GYMJU|nr:MATE efflux family protein [Gymnopilus junonius]